MSEIIKLERRSQKEEEEDGTDSDSSEQTALARRRDNEPAMKHDAAEPCHYKKRICTHAVEDPSQPSRCIGCKLDVKDGEHSFLETKKWTSETCTQPVETDAYGKIRFGEYGKVAQYIRVDYKTPVNDMIQFLYDEQNFKITKPQLIISVTGGAQNFTIPQKMKTAFKRGLIKAATSTNALIITGGTNAGVMKLVGEAVADSLVDLSKISVLGIATWGKTAYREKLVHGEDDYVKYHNNMEREVDYRQKKNEDGSELKKDGVELDPNHTHFLLVDNGSIGEYGVDINFRAALENELTLGRPLRYYKTGNNRESLDPGRTGLYERDLIEKIPMILIVVQGGPRTLETVLESVEKGVPVLVLAQSKGCADLIANANSLRDKSDHKLYELIVDSKMFVNRRTGANDDEKIRKARTDLRKIFQKSDLLNVFCLDSDESSHDIELAILKVFLNSRKTDYYENLKLAIKWNQLDLAKTQIFNGEESFDKKQLFSLMELAIIENKPDFVELLIENNIDLTSFLTERRLMFLYNSNKVQKDARKAPIYQLLKSQYHLTSEKKLVITYKFVEKFCRDIGLEYIELNFLPKSVLDDAKTKLFLKLANDYGQTRVLENYDDLNTYGKEETANAAQNLFLWALLHNRVEMAQIFWRIGRYHIINALFASAILKKMAYHVADIRAELTEHADNFENLATGVLDVFDMNTDDRINIDILLKQIVYFKTHALQVAQIGDCKQFVAHPAVQNLLTSIWVGHISYKIGLSQNIKFLLSCATFGLLAPIFMVDDDDWIFKMDKYNREKWDDAVKNKEVKAVPKLLDSKPNDNNPWVLQETPIWNCCKRRGGRDSEILYRDDDLARSDSKRKSNSPTQGVTKKYFERYKRFTGTPRVLFLYDVVAYLVFLLLFSYMMLCQFNFRETITVTVNSSNGTDAGELVDTQMVVRTKPTVLQYLLIFWVFTFFCEEIRQFLIGYAAAGNFYLKVKSYLNDNWNYLDMAGCLIFSIGMCLRITAFFLNNENFFIAARVILCIDLIVWYIRILHVTLVFKSLGPKLVMIKKMVLDLIFFISIIAVFVCSFGITTQATLYPNSTLNFDLFKSIVNKAYWPIYGEMKILDDDLGKDNCKEGSDDCPEAVGVVFSYIALMIYMVIANVLLINLLIAMFSSTFQHVQENTDKIWKFQRYRLVFEYKNLLILPPPLIIFSHIIELCKLCCRKRKHGKANEDTVEKGVIVKVDVTKYESENDAYLYNNEKKYAEIHLRKEKARQREQIESRLKINSEKLEMLEQKLNEIIQVREKETEQLYTAMNWIMDNIGSGAGGDTRRPGQQIPFLESLKVPPQPENNAE